MREALVQRPSICEHPPKSGARVRFYSVVDLVNRLERPVTGGRPLPGTSTANGFRPAARQPNRELAKPLRKEIARWGDGRSTRYSGARATEHRGRHIADRRNDSGTGFANRSANLANRSHKYKADIGHGAERLPGRTLFLGN